MQLTYLLNAYISQSGILQNIDFVTLSNEVYLMQNHHNCVILCPAESHQIIENLLTYLHIQTAQRVVQQKNLVFGV